jgi:asparagine synthase (glutamine-hydrolysing)
MCGIAGVFDISARSTIDRQLLRTITDAIAHRGPDGDGFHFEAGVGLGHRRLAIIDVAGGQQPLFNEDASVSLVYNGEIYNYQDLIPELVAAGHVFKTRCDAEVVIHAWEQWGTRCLDRFRGMFAFALHDARQGCLFLARDRLGKKPLYYTLIGNSQLVFASELKAILAHPGVRRNIDPFAVDNYMAYGYVPDPGTIYRGIFKLPPAHHLTVTRGKRVPTPKGYWRLRFGEHAVSLRDAEAELIPRLAEATRIRLMSEVPLGAFLSGGVDSSGVVAMMARERDTPVKTFAIGFGNHATDELSHAMRVANRYGTEHHSEIVDVDPLNAFRALAAIFDEPFADSSAIPTLRVSELARRSVTVALSGDAGDEMFAGYRRYRLFAKTDRMRHLLPAAGRRALFGTLGRLYPKLDWAPRWMRAKYTFEELALNSAMGYYRMICRLQDAQRRAISSDSLKRELGDYCPAAIVSSAMEESGTEDPVSRAQYADIKTYLAGDILTKVDRASMAVSLEARVPMLDQEFVAWAATLPSNLKLKNGEGKYVLKRALEPYVPHENLYRPKQGFTTSLAPHFRVAGRQFLNDTLLSEPLKDCGFFNVSSISLMIDEHVSGARDHSRALWTLLMFESFLSQVHSESVLVHMAPPVSAIA